MDDPHIIRDAASLRALYGQPYAPAIAKQVDYLHPHYQAFVRASPFVILATAGGASLDASPRGDAPGFVAIKDERTLLLPDRRGNNRVDCLLNITIDPRVALLFLIPGIEETLRVNGTAQISIDPALLARFIADGKPSKSVLIVHVQEVFVQCAKALMRSELWNPDRHVRRDTLPSTGTILSALTAARVDAEEIDRTMPQRLREALY